jgi:catechol 2,3-dioxygenase-like lactoylglutathione lyase family enzyme
MPTRARMVTLVPIRNMSRALRFYTKVLGGRLVERGRGAMRNYWASITVGGAGVWLIVPGERERRKLAYTTLLVGNIRTYVKGLRRRGVRFARAERMSPKTRVEGPIAFDELGATAFFSDPDGNLWMVWQSPRAT